MKRLLLTLVCLCLLFSMTSNAQTFNTDGKTTFYEVIQDYFDTSHYVPCDSCEGGVDGMVKEMNMTWSPRLSPHGNCQVAAKALVKYSQSYNYANSYYSPNWVCLGPTGIVSNYQDPKFIGQMHRITFDPNYNGTTRKTVYASSFYGGLWRSQNAGESWTLANTDNIPLTSVSDIAVSAQDSNHLFISTGMADLGFTMTYGPNWGYINPIFTVGIFRSLNYGSIWEPINNGFLEDFTEGGTTRRMIINPVNQNQLFVATTKGIYRTNNACVANPEQVIWENVFNGLPGKQDLEFRGLEFKPGSPGTIFASGQDIYKSSDGGTTWVNLTGPSTGLDIYNLPNGFKVNRINITVTPNDPDRLYAYIEGSQVIGQNRMETVYIFMYFGNYWHQKHYTTNNPPSSPGPYINISPCWIAIASSPVNADMLYFGETQVWGTENILDIQNHPFELRSPYLNSAFHADVHSLVFEPNVSNPRLFCANHGGVSVKTFPNPNLYGWISKCIGLENAILWAFDDSDFDPTEIASAYQCEGIKTRHKQPDHFYWKRRYGADGYSIRINDSKPDQVFYKPSEDNMQGTTGLHGLSYCSIVSASYPVPLPWDLPDFTERSLPNTFPMVNHPFTQDMYFGFGELYKNKIEIKPDTTPWQGIWEQESDIRKFENEAWKRQITEIAIAESNPDYIYLVTGGQSKPDDYNPWWLQSHLFKSTSGGINGNYGQQNIHVFDTIHFPGANLTGDTIPIITGIAVDPENEQRLWISFTGYIDRYKVWYSGDGGDTWENADPNGSLNNLPVNGIVYQPGTYDRLYIATDAGIYVKDSTMSDWEKYGDFPNVRAVELKINHCLNKIRVATFGRGIWEGDLLPATRYYEITVADTQTWIKNRPLKGNLRVAEGGMLTISCEVNMPPESKIIIEPGGRLVLDSGHISNGCGLMWKGIEVWGNADLSQIPQSNQGVLQIMNGGTIENAYTAVFLGKRDCADCDETVPGYTGGIILADSARFVNNRVAVNFAPYDFTNYSHFSKCSFLTTSALVNGELPKHFVYLYDVKNVHFHGCIFENSFPGTEYYEKGKGIFSLDAEYRVTSECLSASIPCTQYRRSLFKNLTYGIYALNGGAALDVQIDSTDFINNQKGLYMSGFTSLSGARVLNNDFSVFELSNEEPDSYGMYLDYCTGFHVEGNSFSHPSSSSVGIGLIVNESGSASNWIYRNTFSNLEFATLAQGRNRDTKGTTGLCYKCNTFSNNATDIAVTRMPGPLAKDMGIAAEQGSSNPPSPAGNIFSDFASLVYNIDNQLNAITYFHHAVIVPGTKLRPSPNNGLVTNYPIYVPYNPVQDCPSMISGGGGGHEEKERMDQADSQADSISLFLTSLVDGGSTEVLAEVVETSTPPEALPTWEELLSASPYLTDSVMKTAIEKETVLDNAMIRDVLVANTHSAKSEELMTKLDERTVPMPDYMMAQIFAGEDSVSAKEKLEAAYTYYDLIRNDACNKLIHYYKGDDQTTPYPDSLVLLLSGRSTPEAFYDLASWYLMSNDFSSMDATLAQVPLMFELTGEQLDQHQAYLSFFSLMQDIVTDTTYPVFDSLRLATIENIATSGDHHPAVLARNLLIFHANNNYVEPIILPDNGLKSSKRDKYRGAKPPADAPRLKIFPNPAQNYFIVEHHLEKEPGHAEIVLIDGYGHEIAKYRITGKNNQEVIDTRSLKPSVYLILMKADGKVIERASIAIIK